MRLIRNYFLQVTLAILSLFLLNSFNINGEDQLRKFNPATPDDPEFISDNDPWIDSIMSSLSLEEKIAQMIMIPAYSNRDETHLEELTDIVKKEKVGGVLFFQGGPVRQAIMTNRLQNESETPLLIAIDGEWGLGMRLDSVITYPKQMMLGAICDDKLIYRMGYDIARQMKILGIHMNFAPVADINNNPANPVINIRSFGEDRNNVAGKVIAYFTGMQDNGLLVTAKHFPGHGDTDTDSHYALPVIGHPEGRLDSIELYPFREAIHRGLSGIMVAHLQVLSLDERPDRPSSLSERIIQDLLIQKMDFKGLVVTDALNMKGSSDFFEAGELEIEAVKAGNDILLMPSDPHKAIQEIKKAVKKGDITEDRIDLSCRKILMAKHWTGLEKPGTIDTDSLVECLNSREYMPLQEDLSASALTLLENRDHLLPLAMLEKRRIATVNIGKTAPNAFTRTLDLYLESTHIDFPENADLPARIQILQQLKGFNTVIINLYGLSPYASRNYGISDRIVQFIGELESEGDLILNFAGIPYGLNKFHDLSAFDAVMVSFNDDDLTQSLAAQAIFGGIAINGMLPVTVKDKYPVGTGINTRGGIRLAYSIPEQAGMNYETLLRIDSIVDQAIRMKATPGCQVLAARYGKVIWNKAYGFQTYRDREPVSTDDLYDIASITKITATVPSLMLLKDRGMFSEDSSLGVYLPEADSTNKGRLLIKDILTHQAGLASWIPFYYKTMEPLDSSEQLVSSKWTYTYSYRLGNHSYANRNVKYIDGVYEKSFSREYPIHVAEDLYLRADYRDTVFEDIYESELGPHEYRYSDLGYYLLQKSIEEITDTMLYSFVYFNFLAPLGATTLGYLPLNRFPVERIIPTENDMFFRKQLLRGYVHDPGAAMLGGIGGHAGMFSNANDLAKMMQMYLNGGWYGEDHFIDSATLRIFTSCANCSNGNRRALGFDRPVTDEKNAGPACDDASESSYGHSGFTGTFVWIDPEYDLIYVFLSNKVHPNQSNMILLDENIRTRIQQVLYDAIEDKTAKITIVPVL